MKKTFTDEQIVGILRGFEASGLTIKEYYRQKNMSEQTFYKWRKHFGTMEVEELQQFKQLQQENTRLKKLLAERDADFASRTKRLIRSLSSANSAGKIFNATWRSSFVSSAK